MESNAEPRIESEVENAEQDLNHQVSPTEASISANSEISDDISCSSWAGELTPSEVDSSDEIFSDYDDEAADLIFNNAF
ncbi:uncharacterized protein RHO25_005366 [Cercospora beticola]|uniref:Uncharacterized protein n=1 Tax=Cercospora beticola TaxID=122368 RepID=A0ABZ0NML5_CERBT|nr:hypothetical protein RHO25_005366 [Cercospora beticola]CAK1361020.1 unnamed protein product [Cercospora beticola]